MQEEVYHTPIHDVGLRSKRSQGMFDRYVGDSGSEDYRKKFRKFKFCRWSSNTLIFLSIE